MSLLASSFLKFLRPRGDDDFIDKLNYYYTPVILLILASAISAKQYVGKPIQCWVPPHFTPSMEEYIENYCWIQNTYWLPMYEHIPDDYRTRESRQIGYYQWVPFLLIIQALMFVAPCLFWRLVNWQSGLNLHHLVTSACDVHLIHGAEKLSTLDEIAAAFCDMLAMRRAAVLSATLTSSNRKRATSQLGFWSSRRAPDCGWSVRRWLSAIGQFRHRGCYATTGYVLTKLVYSANVGGQLFMLNAFLNGGADQMFFGLKVLSDLAHGREWTQSGHFPRVTLCDFEVRSVGNLNRYTVQCVLITNVFNEKIFVFVWCWLLTVAALTCYSASFWLFHCAFASQRSAFVAQYLRVSGRNGAENDDSGVDTGAQPSGFVYERFLSSYLSADGVLILRMIANHAGDMIAIELVKRIWCLYRKTDSVQVYVNRNTASVVDGLTEKCPTGDG